MIEGLSHLTFITADLDRMTALIEQVLEGREVYGSGDRPFSIAREKFFTVGELWIAVMEGEALPTRTYNHVAFKIPPDRIPTYRQRIEALGLTILEGRARVAGEGQSLYFYDHDNHLFELHTGSLSERLAHYRAGEP
ncbi:FosX/FosE/FosI family fosfomycin resistance hydrolase [Microvirga antarctica]|uniref:FosX/FosE/FosI family fosfomycin resistance hydrolase n=1 Tax=Microvirga antarctica TaxID=2819233 RepID=UPI0031BB84A6